MTLTLRLVHFPDTDMLIPLLKEADENEARVRDILADGMHDSYALFDGVDLIGVTTLRWAVQESEIEYIAVATPLRGRGYGKAIIAALLLEANARGVHSLVVGTDNTSLDNIAFYQKCGFRMDHIRHDFFRYIQPPKRQNGILMRDMLVLRYVLK
jgi:ribosomal protein S18 acetylase RimI-like enzyme